MLWRFHLSLVLETFLSLCTRHITSSHTRCSSSVAGFRARQHFSLFSHNVDLLYGKKLCIESAPPLQCCSGQKRHFFLFHQGGQHSWKNKDTTEEDSESSHMVSRITQCLIPEVSQKMMIQYTYNINEVKQLNSLKFLSSRFKLRQMAKSCITGQLKIHFK